MNLNIWGDSKICISVPLKISVKIPQSYVYFCFLIKFIENRKILDPRNTHEKKSWTHEKPTGNKFGPTKYPYEKILDP